MQKKRLSWGLMVFGWMMIVGGVFISPGYAGSPKKLDPSISRPQLIVNPESIRLGIATLLADKIIFEGSGFKPKDSIFITLLGPKEVKVIVAEAMIQPDGTFKAEVSKLAKITEILRADAGFEIVEKYKEFVIVTKSPIPEGIYTAKVTCMMSDMTAETKLIVKGPSVIDRLKDWIGKLTGKIRYKKEK